MLTLVMNANFVRPPRFASHLLSTFLLPSFARFISTPCSCPLLLASAISSKPVVPSQPGLNGTHSELKRAKPLALLSLKTFSAAGVLSLKSLPTTAPLISLRSTGSLTNMASTTSKSHLTIPTPMASSNANTAPSANPSSKPARATSLSGQLRHPTFFGLTALLPANPPGTLPSL